MPHSELAVHQSPAGEPAAPVQAGDTTPAQGAQAWGWSLGRAQSQAEPWALASLSLPPPQLLASPSPSHLWALLLPVWGRSDANYVCSLTHSELAK